MKTLTATSSLKAPLLLSGVNALMGRHLDPKLGCWCDPELLGFELSA
jgi:hypothetical protein